MDEKFQNKIYTLPTNIGFVDAMAQGVINYAEVKNILLSNIQIYLPTRRSCRSLQNSFLKHTKGKPLILPDMRTIGDVDEDALTLKLPSKIIAKIPPAISPLKRQIFLARLILGMPDIAYNPDQAMKMAHTLGLFIDQIIIEGLSLSDLHKIVPEEFSEHWQITLDFLKILSEHWPKILSENGVIDEAERRNRLIEALCKHWQSGNPDDHIIIAGSTGTVPATSRLMRAALHLKNAVLILPGFDSETDGESWNTIEPQHPQNSLKNLISLLDLTPVDIQNWPYYQTDQCPNYNARRRLFREIMRPAETTHAWQNIDAKDIEPALTNLQKISFDTVQDEALGIALLLRESLETRDKTTALVTPDRNLAKQVRAICKRWNIIIDDSGGQSLFESLRGQYMSLILESVHTCYKPVALLSLLKHGLCKAEHNANMYFETVQKLDQFAFRIKITYSDLNDLAAKLKAEEKPHHDTLVSFLRQLHGIFAPLQALNTQKKHSFTDFLNAHLTVAENLAATDEQNGGVMLWKGDDGEQAALLFTELQESTHLFSPMKFSEYSEILNGLVQNMRVRNTYGTHPRLMILGQMEARLIQADKMIISGLNEGVWPPDTGHDPWMSRPMRKEYGLPSVDMRIGLSAHDFGQCFGAKNIILTRAKTQDNAPSVPSRWLQRMDTILNGLNIDQSNITNKELFNHLHAFKHRDTEPEPCVRPAPKPPKEARPTKLPVTAIESWMRDPYAIYAKYILNLRKLDALEDDMDAALRGSLVHEVCDRFIKEHPDSIPDNAGNIMMDYTIEALGSKIDEPGFWKFWKPRFGRMIAWFLEHENKWRIQAEPRLTETKGRYHFNDLNFTLTAKADRIDQTQNNGIAIIDYKTGQPPTEKSIRAGLSPQLPLEGLIAKYDGFTDLKAKSGVSYMGFWCLSGGQPAGEEKSLKPESLDELIAASESGLADLISAFQNEDTPYYSLPDQMRTPRTDFQDYAHLARVQEWSVLDDQEEVA